MAEATQFDGLIFAPFDGGAGARLACTTVSASVAVPRGEGDDRVLISNPTSVVASVRLGQSGVVATTASIEILPGTQVLLRAPFIGPKSLWVAGITVSGEASLQITSGRGI